jgi:phenylacetate-CoA ligase
MSQLLQANKTTEKLVNKLIPDEELTPSSVEDVLKLPSFFSKLKSIEANFDQPFAELKQDVQDALVFRRLQQLVNIAMVNPLWKELINKAGLEKAPANAEEWQRLPIVDKTVMQPLFTGTRPGMVVPLSHGGFEVVASGGTSSGKPSEIVYSIKELHTTYEIAGDFMGKYITDKYLAGDKPKWMITTLADYQMWSSGTMVGGVLQNIPRVNYIGAGPLLKDVYQHMMGYEGPKAIMGISQGIAYLRDLGMGMNEEARNSFKVGMYGSGVLSKRKQAELLELYPNLVFLSYFAATQAETIGLQLDHTSPLLSTIPGLHFIEIVDKDGNWVKEGEEGELVVTRLHATEAPILRFKLGDRMIRRPFLDTAELKTQQIEFSGRSGDVLHITDSQYPAKLVYEALTRDLKNANIINLDTMAHDLQFVNNRQGKRLSLMVSVDNPFQADAVMKGIMGPQAGHLLFSKALIESLSIFNQGEANIMALGKTGYSFDIRFVPKDSPELFRTEVGKVPFLKDIA